MEMKPGMYARIKIKQHFSTVLIIFATHFSIYMLAQFLVKAMHLPLHYIALPIDEKIPLVPFFVLPYWLCYAQWALSYYVIGRERMRRNRFSAAMLFGSLICFAIYMCWPTAIKRPLPEEAGMWYPLFQTLYQLDAPVNVFPSTHCFLAWMCYIGVRKQEDISIYFKAFTLVSALIVFAATVFVKQHYFIDILPGAFIAEFSYAIADSKAVNCAADRFWERTYRSLKCKA